MTVRVLIVDDQEPFRLAARMVVELTDGFEVVGEAETGEDSVTMAADLHPDLVLMDVNLPRLDGQRASRALKSDPDTRAIPIVAFSAGISTTAELPTGGSIFDGYILKPIGPSELVRRVASFLERHTNAGLHGIRQTSEVEIPHLERGHHDITA